jgi:hypothetical protein
LGVFGVVFAGLALLVSVISFYINYRGAENAERHGRMPVVIPVPPIQPDRITLRNIGNGPALNIVIAEALEDLARKDALEIDFKASRYKTMWRGPYHLQPLESKTERSYRWRWGGAVGLSYTDALGNHYTTLASTFGTKVADGRLMPTWALSELEYPELSDNPP